MYKSCKSTQCHCSNDVAFSFFFFRIVRNWHEQHWVYIRYSLSPSTPSTQHTLQSAHSLISTLSTHTLQFPTLQQESNRPNKQKQQISLVLQTSQTPSTTPCHTIPLHDALGFTSPQQPQPQSSILADLIPSSIYPVHANRANEKSPLSNFQHIAAAVRVYGRLRIYLTRRFTFA